MGFDRAWWRGRFSVVGLVACFIGGGGRGPAIGEAVWAETRQVGQAAAEGGQYWPGRERSFRGRAPSGTSRP